jgi:hypothetical protein
MVGNIEVAVAHADRELMFFHAESELDFSVQHCSQVGWLQPIPA